MKLLDDTDPSLVIPISDSTLGVALESMERMTKAVLYARVSSDAQQKEGTKNGATSESALDLQYPHCTLRLI